MDYSDLTPYYPEDYMGDVTLPDIIDSDALMDKRFPRQDFIIDSLLQPGLCVLAGSPKVGKSWMVLNLCLQISKGEPFWGMKTTEGDVLYFALEDNERRLQNRMNSFGEEMCGRLHLATDCEPLGDRLEDQIDRCMERYPALKLIVLDTFQKVRRRVKEMSYANDYAEVSRLKSIADRHHICILLVHHTRKMGDSDYINEISGTNGIAGSADTLMVLKRENRSQAKAVLTCTGRDIEDRELKLQFNKSRCQWELKEDTLSYEEEKLPPEMEQFAAFIKELDLFEGSNAELCKRFCAYAGVKLTAQTLRQKMQRWRYLLEDRGVLFVAKRTKRSRTIEVLYQKEMDHFSESYNGPDVPIFEEALAPLTTAAPTSDREIETGEPASDRVIETGEPVPELVDMPPTPTDDDAPPERSCDIHPYVGYFEEVVPVSDKHSEHQTPDREIEKDASIPDNLNDPEMIEELNRMLKEEDDPNAPSLLSDEDREEEASLFSDPRLWGRPSDPDQLTLPVDTA